MKSPYWYYLVTVDEIDVIKSYHNPTDLYIARLDYTHTSGV